jgi:PPOX class probable FMN-dependent enzyme
MSIDTRFAEVVTSEDQLRDIIGQPAQRSVDKTISSLDVHCRAFIAQSPFVMIASCDAEGHMDVSPKGDPPGFVRVLDDRTLAIPDRPGNRRIDTYRNLLQTGNVGLLFLIPGKQETLRVNGRATIVRDTPLRESMAVNGKVPHFALVVAVEEVFFHCAKCMIRSRLWDDNLAIDHDSLPSLAAALVDHARLEISVEELQNIIDTAYEEALY